MNEKIYQLIPVANGYIVVLPDKQFNQWEGLVEVSKKIEADKSGIPVGENDSKEKDSLSYVFKTLSEAIAFLKLKIENEI